MLAHKLEILGVVSNDSQLSLKDDESLELVLIGEVFKAVA